MTILLHVTKIAPLRKCFLKTKNTFAVVLVTANFKGGGKLKKNVLDLLQ